eukprot:3621675-Prorocentrum_lima.AAC.1
MDRAFKIWFASSHWSRSTTSRSRTRPPAPSIAIHSLKGRIDRPISSARCKNGGAMSLWSYTQIARKRSGTRIACQAVPATWPLLQLTCKPCPTLRSVSHFGAVC